MTWTAPHRTRTTPDGLQHDYAAYLAEVSAPGAAVAGRDLDETFVTAQGGRTCSLRWVYLAMIQEYARHNGHADLLRERTDGETGDYPRG
ncbi:DUF664 domain-containing protein [Streptomyces sp. DT20]|uniref:mycothiol transferase n=1 Tax=Streptomyces sp. DT20 TaxID=3416519 RepID=UPI003CF47462